MGLYNLCSYLNMGLYMFLFKYGSVYMLLFKYGSFYVLIIVLRPWFKHGRELSIFI